MDNRSVVSSAIDSAENFYAEHEKACNLCLLTIAGIGIGAGLKAASRTVPETFAEAGTKEFAALSDPERLANARSTRSLMAKWGIGDKEFYAEPSSARDASRWFVTRPTELEQDIALDTFGPAHAHISGPAIEMQSRNFVTIIRAQFGRVVLNKADSTARLFDTNGNLKMELNRLGDEIHYGADGKILGIGRGVFRNIDVANHWAA